MEHSRQMIDAWHQQVDSQKNYAWSSSFPYLQSPDMEREFDFIGDPMDDSSDDLCSELKSIALWGGVAQFRSVLLAYNDLKCSEALLAALPSFPEKGVTNDHIVNVAKLIARNRFGLIALEKSGCKFPVTQNERVQVAMKKYKRDPTAVLRFPPKKVVSQLWSRMERECTDAAGGKELMNTKDIFDHVLKQSAAPLPQKEMLLDIIDDFNRKIDDHCSEKPSCTKN